MKSIKRTNDIVKHLLETQPATRNSDDVLYIKVCEHFNKDCVQMPFSTVFLNRNELDLPPFESVRRTRQKLQATYPELAGNEDVEAARMLNESIVRDYARQVVV